MDKSLYNTVKVARLLAYLLAFISIFLIEGIYGLLLASILIIASELIWRYVKIVKEGVPNDERDDYILMMAERLALESFLLLSGFLALIMSFITHIELITLEESVRKIIQGYYLGALVIIVLYAVWYAYYSKKSG